MILTSTALGFGSAGLTSLRSYGQAKRLLNVAFDKGITHFDTAPLYGQGYAEKILGTFVKGKRDKITITTKFGLGQPPDLKIPFQLALPLNYYKKKWRGIKFVPGDGESLLEYRSITLPQVKTSLENSLRSLNTEYIDYYFLHEAVPGFLTEEARQYLKDQKSSGVIRFLGVATGSINIRRLQPEELSDWDVLQYEAGPYSNSEDIKTLFPGKTRFVHSCLKYINKFDKPGLSQEEKAGFILAEQAHQNPNGKVLFFTRRLEILKQNLHFFDKFYKEGSKSQ